MTTTIPARVSALSAALAAMAAQSSRHVGFRFNGESSKRYGAGCALTQYARGQSGRVFTAPPPGPSDCSGAISVIGTHRSSSGSPRTPHPSTLEKMSSGVRRESDAPRLPKKSPAGAGQGKSQRGGERPPRRCRLDQALDWSCTPEPVLMSTSLVSRRNSSPMMKVITATTIGYQSP